MKRSVIGLLRSAYLFRGSVIRTTRAVSTLMFVLLISSCSGTNSLPEALTMEEHPAMYPFPDTDRKDPFNPYRYIAHAGGVYNGMTYTDSLEAMELSASKGFRMFELDLILTSDNQIAAAHDWTYWKMITGYTGETPPTLAEFRQTLIHGSLTPLSMADIAVWFSAHPEAILVTDKITDYEKLAAEFPYPERLIVEVFTLNEYIRARRAGIRYPLLSLDTAAAGPDGEWLYEFITGNRIPMAVLSTAAIGIFTEETAAINGHGGYMFAYTSNDTEFLATHPELFGIYTDSINFTDMTSGTISDEAPRFRTDQN